MQRYAQDTARLRLDIAGYAERRRQALTIYAERLIDQLLSEGGEIMLEPMSPADRKVIHDVAASREGVNSYSEGEAPRRYVVLTATAPVSDQDSEEE
jgi:spoIIIJ-associated protein